MGEVVLRISAKPEDVHVNPRRSAVIVVDMQNAFVSQGGMFDIIGISIAGVRRIIEPLKKVLEISRSIGLRIIYVRHVYSSDLSDAGGQDSPNYWKEYSLVLMRKNPAYRKRLLVKGTWGAEVIDEIKPSDRDIIIDKKRYSGFVNTCLENILRDFDIKYLFFTGIALNICVESSVRDAFSREYWPILISDCCEAIGPKYVKKATLWNIKQLFGWVTTSKNFINAVYRMEFLEKDKKR